MYILFSPSTTTNNYSVCACNQIEVGSTGSNLYEVLQTYNSKNLWSDWIRLSTARAVTDIREFVEKSTNDTTTGFDESFLAGFTNTAEQVVLQKHEILNSLCLTEPELLAGQITPREGDRESIVDKQARGTEFIGKLIDVLEEELLRVLKNKEKWATLRMLTLGQKTKKFALSVQQSSAAADLVLQDEK